MVTFTIEGHTLHPQTQTELVELVGDNEWRSGREAHADMLGRLMVLLKHIDTMINNRSRKGKSSEE